MNGRQPGDGPTDRPLDRDEALAAAVDGAGEEVLAQALADARERVRRDLAQLLTPALLDAALASAARPEMHRTHQDPPTPTRATYVYAVSRADVPTPTVLGLDGRTPVETVAYDGVALLVSMIDPGLLDGIADEPVTETGRLATLARRHDGVVTAAFAQAPVLPLRFGTVLRDRVAAEQLVRQRHAQLDGELSRLSGHAEYGVRVVASGDTDEREEDAVPARTAPLVGQDESEDRGTSYLARRRHELTEREQRRERTTEALDRALRPVRERAADSVAAEPERYRDGVVHESAYLVAQARAETFQSAVTRAATDLRTVGLDIELAGPWPPYTFARISLQAEATDGA
ncbi:MAG: GvpL/GvpF family gas vesicle protein [Actinomycetes bacterium]